MSVKCCDNLNKLSFDITIPEEQPKDSLLYDLSHEFNQRNKTLIDFKFLRPCPYFYLKTTTGQLLFSEKYDREYLCGIKRVCTCSKCQLKCDILARSKGDTTIIQLNVELQDLNDHMPQFQKNYYLIQIPESVPVGYRIQLEQAQDLDTGFHSILNYTLQILNKQEFEQSFKNSLISRQKRWSSSSSFPFELDFDRIHHLLTLVVREELDYESNMKSYFGILRAEDGDHQYDETILKIQVLDVNDTPPRFTQLTYRFQILENSNISTIVGFVYATDLDTNDKITYSISPTDDEETRATFTMNKLTGEIRLKSSIDYERRSYYRLTIEAHDLNSLSSYAYVDIDIINVDDNSPIIQISIPKLLRSSKSTELQVIENSPVPLSLLQLYCYDPDGTSTSNSFTLIMSSSPKTDDYFKLKKIDDQSYDLKLERPFDREELGNTIKLEFIVNNDTRTMTSVTIIILDENDSEPRFEQNNYEITVTENNLYPKHVYTFKANDPDMGNNGNVKYTMKLVQTNLKNISNIISHFSLNDTTGELVVLTKLDRENISIYSYEICVNDQGQSLSLHSCTTLVILVLDLNDCVPLFSSSILNIDMYENLQQNEFITQVQAYDADQGENGIITYHIQNKTMLIDINSTHGIITATANVIDREEIEFLSTVIVACDHGKPEQLCSRCTLNIHILDRNDNKPLLFDPSSSDILIIDQNHHLKSFQLYARDIDSEIPNNVIDYSIIGGTLSSNFVLNRTSGQLSLKNEISSILYGTLDIRLCDQGLPLPLMTFYTLTFLIHDNSTNASDYLNALKTSSSLVITDPYSSLFYFSIVCVCLILIFVLPLIFVLFNYYRRRQMKNKLSVNKHDNYNDPLMKQQQSSFHTNSDIATTLTTNTPTSSVTLSTKSSLPPETKIAQTRIQYNDRKHP
ncbi:unnamed protein product, partial [Didymodactylos carnosus]